MSIHHRPRHLALVAKVALAALMAVVILLPKLTPDLPPQVPTTDVALVEID